MDEEKSKNIISQLMNPNGIILRVKIENEATANKLLQVVLVDNGYGFINGIEVFGIDLKEHVGELNRLRELQRKMINLLAEESV